MVSREEKKTNRISETHAEDGISSTYHIDGEPLPLGNYSQKNTGTHGLQSQIRPKLGNSKPSNIIQAPRKP
jgi:hypothetical protein